MHVIVHDKIVQRAATRLHKSHHSDIPLRTGCTGLPSMLQFLSRCEPLTASDIACISRDEVIRGRHVLKWMRPFALFG